MFRTIATAATTLALLAGPSWAAHAGSEDGLELGMTVSDVEAVGLSHFGRPVEMDHGQNGDPEATVSAACTDGKACVSAAVDFTAPAIGQEAYLMTITRRFDKPQPVDTVLKPVKKRFGKESRRVTEAAGGTRQNRQEILHVLWGKRGGKLEALKTYSDKLDLLTGEDGGTGALMQIELAGGKVRSYTLMVMDRERYRRNRDFHDSTAAQVRPGQAQVAGGSLDEPAGVAGTLPVSATGSGAAATAISTP